MIKQSFKMIKEVLKLLIKIIYRIKITDLFKIFPILIKDKINQINQQIKKKKIIKT